MIPVQVRGDDVPDLGGVYAKRFEALANGMEDGSSAFLCRRLVEAGIDDKDAMRPLDDPHVIGDRGHLVVRIAEDIIFRTLAAMAGVSDGEDLVNVARIFLAHFGLPTVTPA